MISLIVRVSYAIFCTFNIYTRSTFCHRENNQITRLLYLYCYKLLTCIWYTFYFADLTKEMGFLERWNRNKNNSQRIYTERRPLETIGSVIFVFCKPLFVIGVILTIVIYTEKDPTDSISSFRIIGPVCLSLSAVFFVCGGFMTSPYFPLVLERCRGNKITSGSIAAAGLNKEEPTVKTVRVHPLKTADPVVVNDRLIA